MQYGWDDRKHAWNLRERGFGCDFAARVFAGRTIERVDDRFDYGEVRVIAIGAVGTTVLAVVYTDRLTEDGQPLRWIISARVADRKERARWRT